jgi:hypothetical protein
LKVAKAVSGQSCPRAQGTRNANLWRKALNLSPQYCHKLNFIKYHLSKVNSLKHKKIQEHEQQLLKLINKRYTLNYQIASILKHRQLPYVKYFMNKMWNSKMNKQKET